MGWRDEDGVAAMVTPDFSILRHALGITEDDDRDPWRNHYVTDANDKDCEELVSLGLLREPGRRASFLSDDDRVYLVTDEGKAVALRLRAEARGKRPKPTRSQARYQQWMEIADAINMPFGEFLRREREFRR